MHCTFCIVPSTRGAERSRPIAEIVAEVESLVRQGVKEVTLLGQIVNLYGRHEFPAVDGRSPFAQLLHAVCAVPGLERLRFTSPHPIGFKDDIVACFRELPNLCEHVHLPLQSGSDRILKAMHRAYTGDEIPAPDRQAPRRASRAWPSPPTSSSAFPARRRTISAQTCDLVREVAFDNAFIFRYSPRRDTPAATMPDQLAEEVKMERNQTLLAHPRRDRRQRATRRCSGTRGRNPRRGRKPHQRPSVSRAARRTNRLVLIEANERWRGELLPVRLTESTGFTYYAEPVLR